MNPMERAEQIYEVIKSVPHGDGEAGYRSRVLLAIASVVREVEREACAKTFHRVSAWAKEQEGCYTEGETP